MAEQQESREILDEMQLENARVGYQVAASLWAFRAGALWSQFNAILTANSIVLATTLAIGRQQPALVLSVGLSVVGLVLCALWLLLLARGFSYTHYWVLSARELEERFLSDPVSSLSRGGSFGDGRAVELVINGKLHPLRMSLLGRIFRVRWAAYLVVLVFAAMHLTVLICGVN